MRIGDSFLEMEFAGDYLGIVQDIVEQQHEDTFESGVNKIFKFPAYKVCEMIFDVSNRKCCFGGNLASLNKFLFVGFGDKGAEGRRAVIEREVNEHHIIAHTEMRTPKPLLPREAFFKAIWQEVSHDNFVVIMDSFDYSPDKYSEMTHVRTTFKWVVWIKGNSDGSSCRVACRWKVNLGGNVDKYPLFTAMSRKSKSNALAVSYLDQIEELLKNEAKREFLVGKSSVGEKEKD